jgi:hypothetical protein
VRCRGSGRWIPIRLRLVVVKAFMIAGVVILPLPALFLGVRGVMGRRRIATESADRVSLLLLVVLRLLVLLLIVALSAVSLLSLIGAVLKDVPMPSLVYIFFFLDLLLGALVLLTFGRRDRRRARRPATPATR